MFIGARASAGAPIKSSTMELKFISAAELIRVCNSGEARDTNCEGWNDKPIPLLAAKLPDSFNILIISLKLSSSSGVILALGWVARGKMSELIL